MALTYTAIATVTVGSGGAANIEFTSIPATYTDLVIKLSARSDVAIASDGDIVDVQFNGSTSNLSQRLLRGTGSSADSSSSATRIFFYRDPSDYTASTFNNAEIYIPNYAGSTNKSLSIDNVNENNATQAYQMLIAGLWANTAAITSIKLLGVGVAKFTQYSTATLYGIKNTV